MDSFEFNTVKAEKAQATRNYNLQKMLKKLELFTALSLLAWSCYSYIPIAAKISADFLRHDVAVFGQPLYVFLAINILIAFISVLSSQKPDKHDFYDDYVTITNAPRRSSTAADEPKPAPEVPVSEKQIVCVDNVWNSPVEQNTECAAKAITTTVVKDSEAVRTVTEVKKYRRTRSERLDRGKGNKQELMRRSETLIQRATTEVQKGRRSYEIDDLSNEEFKKTIETFIAAKKKTLIKENTLDLKVHTNQSVALTFE